MEIEKFILNKNNFSFIIISFLFLLLLVIPFQFIKNIFDLSLSNPVVADKSLTYKFIVGVIVVPIFETLIFQVAIIKMCLFFRKNQILAIVISAFTFSLNHMFSAFYMIYAFTIGLYFGYLYFLTLRKKSHPIMVLFSVHALFNLSVFTLSLFYPD